MQIPVMVLSTFALLVLTVSASTPTRPDRDQIKVPLRTQIQPFHANGPRVEAQFEQTIDPAKTAILMYMGVHANMCILNRSFGVRQLSKWGLRCVLVRDLTDAMYNPASRPFVSHAAALNW
jgi:hypothetical protein